MTEPNPAETPVQPQLTDEQVVLAIIATASSEPKRFAAAIDAHGDTIRDLIKRQTEYSKKYGDALAAVNIVVGANRRLQAQGAALAVENKTLKARVAELEAMLPAALAVPGDDPATPAA